MPCIADDSGLEVDALAGAPGVHSKRWTPEAIAETNNAKMLREMAHAENRTARFVCALALVTGKGERVWRGTVEGCIGHALRGSKGFGYDPLFVVAGDPGDRTMAQYSPNEKNAISHRGVALRALLALLEELDS